MDTGITEPALTEGDPAGGLTIAGTGTINLDGTVGPVGGVTAKVRAAADADVDVFFVSAGDHQRVDAAGGAVRVVPVRTLDDAIRWLCGPGGGSGDLCVRHPYR